MSALAYKDKRWRIGLLAPRTHHFYAHEVVSGMISAQLPPGQGLIPVDLLYHQEDDIPKLLAGCQCDALIVGLDRGRYEIFSNLLPDMPTVNVHPDHLASHIPTIAIQSQALAQSTVAYFKSLGIHNLATTYSASTEAQSRVNRRLCKIITASGGTFESYSVPETGIAANYEDHRIIPHFEALNDWLVGLKKPTGVLCSGGYTAIIVASAAKHLKLSIPGMLSILSRSDDNVCLFADPPISSYRSVGPLVGKLALTVLIRHLNGEAMPKGEVSLPAPSVIERFSTGLPVEINRSMSEAVRFIRRNAFKNITVDDVLIAVPSLSRSRLYREFEEKFAHTPAQEIIRLRIAEAKFQLGFTSKSLNEIADHCAFKTAAHFSTVFTREVGMAPRSWRTNELAKQCL